jgi:glyoxylase-like metal-dependent hydrolase (beta-lactamase superfamily II)
MTRPNATPIVEGFALGPFATNCYLVRCGGEAWVVDVSFEPGPMIERARETGDRITRILLTHAHVDHIAGLAEARRAFPEALVAIHPAERSWLANPELNLSVALGEPFSTEPSEDTLEDGQTLEIGGSTWRVVHTPGHSPGGVTLHCPDAGLALVGDTLFEGSIGRYDFPTSDGPTLFRSIQERLYTLPDDTRVLPGHGPETTIGAEKRSNPFVRAD